MDEAMFLRLVDLSLHNDPIYYAAIPCELLMSYQISDIPSLRVDQ